ncbi:hypothetical protein AAFF_G00006670 [Aldrovandia affinis]|uniref:Uncharacterized protein n=1 Tax=Aldrovandia affinis TaxID=143900 RepID=A0AAD7TEC9_9TELE|nr:hypothetical protein AAFF_G00006670 [Aldrovandia affinis]
MEGAVLVCLLCLQGSLLVHTLKCAEKGTDEYGRECAGGHSAKATPAEHSALKPLAPSGELKESGLAQLAQRVRRQTDTEKRRRRPRPGAYSLSSMVLILSTTTPPVSREKRQLESGRDRPNKFYYPGITSVTGQPMRLMLTERARRQLSHNRKKPKHKARVGSLSLLSNSQIMTLQVTRVRRELQNDKRKKGTGRSGRHSVLGKPIPPLQGQRSKRNLQPKKKTTKKIVCS